MNDPQENPIHRVAVDESSSLVIPNPDRVVADRYQLTGISKRIRKMKREPSWTMDACAVFVGAAVTLFTARVTWAPIHDSLRPDKRAHYDLVGTVLTWTTTAALAFAVMFLVVHLAFVRRRTDTTTEIADDLDEVIRRGSP